MAKTTKAKTKEQDTEGAKPGEQTPAAPISEPAGTSAPAPAGEVAAGLPGSDPFAGVTVTLTAADPPTNLVPAGDDIEIIGIDLATPEPTELAASGNVPPPDSGAGGDGGLGMASEITVICHAEGGRRRLGRRWPQGETHVPLDRLSDTDIELLRADPQFSVILPSV